MKFNKTMLFGIFILISAKANAQNNISSPDTIKIYSELSKLSNKNKMDSIAEYLDAEEFLEFVKADIQLMLDMRKSINNGDSLLNELSKIARKKAIIRRAKPYSYLTNDDKNKKSYYDLSKYEKSLHALAKQKKSEIERKDLELKKLIDVYYIKAVSKR